MNCRATQLCKYSVLVSCCIDDKPCNMVESVRMMQALCILLRNSIA